MVRSETALDRKSWIIVRELQEDARISYTELGRRVNLTSPAAAERVHRLERLGVIRGYHADVDPQLLGLPLEVIVRVAPASAPVQRQFALVVRDIPEVAECFHVTGDEGFVLRVLVMSVEHLDQVLTRLHAYGQAVASVVLSKPISRRLIDRTTLGQVADRHRDRAVAVQQAATLLSLGR